VDSQCLNQGYCNCHQDTTSEAAVGLGGILIMMIVGIAASFLYPAIRIMRSDYNYETNGILKFSGTLWLFLSPVFGFLSNMLYQIVFAVGACAANALQSKIANSVYIIGMFAIYLLAIGLAVIAFLFKNWEAIKLFFTKAETRSGGKMLTLFGVGLMVALVLFAGLGIAVAATTGYFSHQARIQAVNDKPSKTISTEAAKYDLYVGKYKFISRDDKTVFQVAKSDDGKNLRLITDAGKTGKTNGKSGCLLSPNTEVNSVYYAVSECIVEGKSSSLSRIYFEVQKSRTIMSFIYNAKTNSDTLKKIK
jgi:hypothetical protein